MTTHLTDCDPGNCAAAHAEDADALLSLAGPCPRYLDGEARHMDAFAAGPADDAPAGTVVDPTAERIDAEGVITQVLDASDVRDAAVVAFAIVEHLHANGWVVARRPW